MLNSKFRCEIPDLQQNVKHNFACVFSTTSVPNWLHAFFESHVKREQIKAPQKKCLKNKARNAHKKENWKIINPFTVVYRYRFIVH